LICSTQAQNIKQRSKSMNQVSHNSCWWIPQLLPATAWKSINRFERKPDISMNNKLNTLTLYHWWRSMITNTGQFFVLLKLNCHIPYNYRSGKRWFDFRLEPIFTTAPAASKKDARFNSAWKRLKNKNIAFLLKIRNTI